MDTTTVYFNPSCSKCRETRSLLETRGEPFDLVEYLHEPVDEAELRRLLGLLACDPADLVRSDDEAFAAAGFTAADIVTGCAAHRWFQLPLKREARPNIERWYAELKSRPGSRQVTSQSLA